MRDKEAILSICSEFSETYGFDVSDLKRLVVYAKAKYINELKNLLEKYGYKLFFFKYMEAKP